MSQLPSYIAPRGTGSLLSVFVQPRAAKDAIAGVHGDALKLKLRAPPVDDRANRAVCTFVGELVGLPASAIELVSGRTSRTKKLYVPLSPDAVAEAIDRLVRAGGGRGANAH